MYDSCGVDFAMHAWLSCHNVVALGVIRFFFFFLAGVWLTEYQVVLIVVVPL